MKKNILMILGVALVLVLALGCGEKATVLKVGDLVFTQYYQGEGNFWDPGKIIAIEGEEVTVKWDDAFAKSDSVAKKHISEVVKKEPLDAKKVKAGMEVIVHPPEWLCPYKGEVTAVEGNDYIVSYKSGSVDVIDTVDISALWKYKR